MLTFAPVSRPRTVSSTIGLVVLCALLIAAWPCAGGDARGDSSDLAASVFVDAAAPPSTTEPFVAPTACLTRMSSEPLCPTGRLVVPELFRPPTSAA